MKDFYGKELNVGDQVTAIYKEPTSRNPAVVPFNGTVLDIRRTEKQEKIIIAINESYLNSRLLNNPYFKDIKDNKKAFIINNPELGDYNNMIIKIGD